jgi:3-oxoacyl-[acyl-carrier protein] reductase
VAARTLALNPSSHPTTGVNVVVTARGEEALQATAAELRAASPGVQVIAVGGDITTPEGRAAALVACPQVDILVNNAGGPPPGDFRDWDREAWIKAVDANMLTPIELIKATVDAMAARGFGRIVNITSGAVKAPIATLGLSNGARTGLTGFVAGLARQPQLAAANVTINNLLPGVFDTDRLIGTTKAAAAKAGQTLEAMLDKRRATIPAARFGSAAEFGAFCAFMCSAHAGYLAGQNILLDGGAYPGTF